MFSFTQHKQQQAFFAAFSIHINKTTADFKYYLSTSYNQASLILIETTDIKPWTLCCFEVLYGFHHVFYHWNSLILIHLYNSVTVISSLIICTAHFMSPEGELVVELLQVTEYNRSQKKTPVYAGDTCPSQVIKNNTTFTQVHKFFNKLDAS